jgi:phospholipase C
MQENRSFDHYFGTYKGVRGFGDKHGRKAFKQAAGAGQTLHPWHLPTGCMHDITHDWGPQHQSWNGGRMDGFVTSRLAPPNGPAAPETMGYFKASDLPFYHALADAFTICDGYNCSVIGPTDPNRLMSMSATIDPAGKAGGPLVETLLSGRSNKFSWHTMPESLQAKGISWKVYAAAGPAGALDNVLTYFTQYDTPGVLADRGLNTVYPDDFIADLDAKRLPQVSWLIPSVVDSEHPGFSSPAAGEIVARAIVEALVTRPEIWKKTALFLTWDENGGFFDHVAPPTAPRGTAGEFLTVASLPDAAAGIRGPIGLGFRVPMLVISPFSRGGLVCSDTFDHTSTLRFLETRFRVRVPNLSHWRRKTTGDLTSAFNFAAKPRYGRPRLPQPSGDGKCASSPPVPVVQGPFPKQQRGTRRAPSGIVKKKKHKHH